HDLGVGSVEELTDAIAATVPAYAGCTRDALAVERDGIVARAPAATLPAVSSHTGERNSYDYRLVVSRKLYDRAVGTAMSLSLAPRAPGAADRVTRLDLDRMGLPAGTDVKVTRVKGAAVLPLVADAAVARGTVWVPFN